MPKKNSSKITKLSSSIKQLIDENVQFRPPLTQMECEQFETNFVSLPDEYRSIMFVTQGKEDDGDGMMLSPMDGLKILPPGVDPKKDFPLSGDEATHCLQSVAALKKNQSKPVVDIKMDGVMPIMDHGCNSYDCVVLNGPLKDTVWHFSDSGCFPYYTMKKKEPVFTKTLEWFSKIIEEYIEAARPQYDVTSAYLDLSCNDFSTKPLTIIPSDTLKELKLHDCKLTKIPSNVFKLINLKRFRVDKNDLKEVPPEIGQLKNLEELILSHNQLESLPDEIGQLTKLTWLSISHNPVCSLPFSIGQLSALQTLIFSFTKIKQLPEEFASLQLKSVGFKDLPNLDWQHTISVLAKMSNLTSIAINSFENMFYSGLSELTQVRTLRLTNLKLSEIPSSLMQLKKLQMLDLESNKIQTVPDELIDMPELKILGLVNNPIHSTALDKIKLKRPDLHIELNNHLSDFSEFQYKYLLSKI